MYSVKNMYNSSPELLAKKCTNGKMLFRPFQQFISQKIVEAITKKNGRLILSVPPQHGKSELASIWLPVWFLSNFPEKHILMFSANDKLAKKFGRKVRNIIRSNKEILQCELSEDSTASERWHTNKDGSMISSGVGGVGVSNPGHLIIIDDPYKSWADAMSENTREKVIDWYTNTVTQRFQEDTTVILIQTRYHELDLAGHLLKNGVEKWQYLRFPAIAEKGDLLKRKVGEVLVPGYKDKKFFDTRKEEMGTMAFAGVYQQSPQAEKGNVFLREYWQKYNKESKPKKFRRIVCSWDTASKVDVTSARSACVILGELCGESALDKSYYYLGTWQGKLTYPKLKKIVIQIYYEYGATHILIEDKSTGSTLIQELDGLDICVVPITPIADKRTRAVSTTPRYEAGRVFTEEGVSWSDELIDKMAAYPSGDCADLVDAASQGIAYLHQTGFISKEVIDMISRISDNQSSSLIPTQLSGNPLPYQGIFKFGGSNL